MSENFQQTVDLKEKLNKQKNKAVKRDIPKKAMQAKRDMVRADGIDEMYSEAKKEDNQLHRIERISPLSNFDKYFKVFVIMAVLFFAGYLVKDYFPKTDVPVVVDDNKSHAWYAVKLVSEEMYYGQIDDIEKNPIIIRNVYYDYDQINKSDKDEVKEGGSLRLVKRGKETYGPDGSIIFYQTQIKQIEPLKEDSKVLKAILDYEK